MNIDQKDQMKIGFLYPETGQLRFLGEGLLDAAIAGIYRINQLYGLDVTLETYDTQTNPEIAVNGALTLVNDGVKIIIGPATSQEVVEASNVTIPAEIPLISPN